MTAQTLKPCPFCGGNPKLRVGLSEFKDGEIHCECGCTSGNHPSAEAAITAWNTRPEIDRLIAEAVKAERERCAARLEADADAICRAEADASTWGGPDPRGPRARDSALRIAAILRGHAAAIRRKS